MKARSLAGALARSDSSVATPTNWAWRWGLAAFVVVMLGVLTAHWMWTEGFSGRAVAARWAEREVANGLCLLSQEWPHVDAETGLVVAKVDTSRVIACSRSEWRSMWANDWNSPQNAPASPEEFVDAWNSVMRSHLAAEDANGPRFRDRVTTLDAVRERFRCDPAAAVALSLSDATTIAGLEARWWGTTVNLREPGGENWRQPVGGRPVEPQLDSDAIDVTLLTADAGRSLWVRVASKTGQDLWYFVLDLATGTHLYTFDAAPR
jgi:hypothetical protein